MSYALSIDIGSTYTKGALFGYDEHSNKPLELLAREVTSTTVDCLPRGFEVVASSLRRSLPAGASADVPVYFSSSAKGGLAIFALGIVPDLTLKTAKITALSAGGKVVGCSAYKLTSKDIAVLEEGRPDVVLLAGGTDGGNESFLRHNAKQLLKSEYLRDNAAVIFAGNEVLAEEIPAQLREAGFDVRVAENIMPEVDTINPDSARARIREVFLQRIVKGKGLDALIAKIGRPPHPTPFAVLSLVEAISKYAPDFGEFVLADLGGATTDIYSYAKDDHGAERVVYRGLPEPLVKRTVEGDLGMRVSAKSVAAFVPEDLQKDESFQAFIAKVNADTSFLPIDELGRGYDNAMAQTCLDMALLRHVGTQKRVFTAMGDAFVQQGKDLRGVSRMIGSGGFLSQAGSFAYNCRAELGISDLGNGEMCALLPQKIDYYRDAHYIFPLLGNVVGAMAERAVVTALDYIV